MFERRSESPADLLRDEFSSARDEDTEGRRAVPTSAIPVLPFPV